jgi:deferrochelatase/peroxidase EfeB
MNPRSPAKMDPARRRFLALTGIAAAAAAGSGMGAAPALRAAADAAKPSTPPQIAPGDAVMNGGQAKHQIEPFYAAHQVGIITPTPAHTYFGAFDLTSSSRADVIRLLRDWTGAAARLTMGQCAQAVADNPASIPADSGEALGLPPARLTITFGFGPGLFDDNGKDRFGLAKHRPAAMVDLPKFPGDQLIEARTGGDLSIQTCADDPQVAFHAFRQLSRLAYGGAQVRWTQSGYIPNFGADHTPRNLMGFKDGTSNPATDDASAMAKFVWAGAGAPSWMQNGSYLVARRIRIALEHWDMMKLGFQEQVIGRHKVTGAPLGAKHEFDDINLDAQDADGNPLIADNAHVRLAIAASNNGARILRRAYSYNDGVSFTSERWPPWRQGMEYDAGLFFLAYQSDPRDGFIKIFQNMSRFDVLNQFVTHTGGGIFACPGGIAPGEYVGQRLFENA